jgi:hypothetical protein
MLRAAFELTGVYPARAPTPSSDFGVVLDERPMSIAPFGICASVLTRQGM